MDTRVKPRVIAVIPAFNEKGRVGRVIQGIPKDVVDEVLVIDDHSTDSTARESLRAGASVICQNGPRGVGAARKTGYREGLTRRGEILVVLAGDMQHDPTEIPRLLEVIQNSHAEYVTGDRLSTDPVAYGMPPLRYVGNMLLTFLTRLITGPDVRDSQCGFTAMTKVAIQKIELESLSDTWGVTNSLLAECKRNHFRVRSVPVSIHYGTRRSHILLPQYIACIILVLLRAWLRTHRTPSPDA